VRKSVVLPGRVIADPNRSGVVQSINGGRVIAPEGGLPKLGQPVSRGDLLALVEPAVNAADDTSISDKVGELSQQIAMAEAKLARFTQLAATNAVPKTQVIDLEIELDALRKRLASVRAQRREAEQLRAPVSGTIAANGVVAGQVVGTQDRLFQIVDPGSLWVEALAFGGADAGAIVAAAALRADNGSVPLKLEGVGRALQRQAVQVHFSVAGPAAELRVGESLRVVAQTKDSVKGIVLPREAVVRASNGETIVWTLVAPERFEPKPVRVVPVDGARVAVTAGLRAGERVVVQGAELVNQIR
jgi:membrane fusion protein, heavy metal efflux system